MISKDLINGDRPVVVTIVIGRSFSRWTHWASFSSILWRLLYFREGFDLKMSTVLTLLNSSLTSC